MQEEVKALHNNQVWKLVPLPPRRKVIRNKWVYMIKHDSNDQVERYRVRSVVKRYAKKKVLNSTRFFLKLFDLHQFK